ncbi:tripartite tricarboxylate transporter TctB family protein [Modicisalibacter radicis]|uniref:tripartite tricarboxylate transporter TctB family protein n=1 Tax=Halomonas sp. EAR18 TaxID=2518972 RepID=UPI00109D558D|nr:tripartite tricarboxylate transporter TctB family protein [Halomonas sp. EAR18]
MRKPLYVFIGCVMVTAGFFLALTWQLPGSDEVSTLIGPRLWPLMVLVLMLVFSVLLLIQTRRKASEDVDAESAPSTSNTAAEQPGRWRALEAYRHWLLLALVIAYTVGMEAIGFLPATVFFTLLATWVLGARQLRSIVLTTFAGALMVAVVFDALLNIPLP